MDALTLDAVHAYWFGPLPNFDSFPADRFSLWFGGGEAVDSEIARRFGPALIAAAIDRDMGALTPEQLVARIVLLDQLSRNIHRNNPEAYRLDPLARRHADAAIAGGIDRFKLVERVFVLLPLGHSEDLSDQERVLELYGTAVWPHAPEGNRFYEAGRIQSQRYRDIIARFGRFPHRNEVLGRRSTPEEMVFIAEARITPF